MRTRRGPGWALLLLTVGQLAAASHHAHEHDTHGSQDTAPCAVCVAVETPASTPAAVAAPGPAAMWIRVGEDRTGSPPPLQAPPLQGLPRGPPTPAV